MKRIIKNKKLLFRLIRMDFKQIKTASFGFLGGLITIYLLSSITTLSNHPLIMAPFGASCVLVFAAHNSPLAQPKNVILGHLSASFVGIAFKILLGNSTLSLAITVGFVIWLMTIVNIKHPPAGADPIIIFKENVSWDFLLMPVLLGSIIIVALGYAINNLDKRRCYPHR